MTRTLHLRLLVGVSVIAFTTAAHGQTAAPATTAATTSVPPAADQNAGIVVTGSRTIRNGNSSPSPVTMISTQDALKTSPGGTLADALNTLPVFAGSRGPSSNPSTTGTSAAGNGGANQLNLRNLGANRTLILVDGFRVPPTTANGIVDVDLIPQMLTQRVDVVTGGVSAVYGSDAVAGVVNYIIDKKFTGINVTATNGISQRGDAQRQDYGIAAGTSVFGGRGHIEGSYEYIDEAGIPYRTDRSWLNSVGVTGAGTAANPYKLQTNVHQASFPYGGLITSGALAGQAFATNGVLSPFVHGTATGTSALEIGGEGGTYDSSLIAPLTAHQIFGRFDFDVTPDIHFYAQVSGDIKTNTSNADTLELTGETFSSTNAFLPAAYQTALANARQTTFKLSELVSDLPRLNAIAKSSQWMYMGGLTGTLGKFHWAANYTHGVTLLNTTLTDNPNYQHLAAALDAVQDGSGNIVCQSAAVNPGCVPINVFGPNAVSSAAAGYVLEATHYHTATKLDDAAAQIDGSPFSTWAGPVTVALSGEIRRLTFESSSDATPSQFVNCTGLRYNCTSTTPLWGYTFAASPLVSQTVKEAAFEVDAPLVKDVPFIKEFSINGAARYTSYSTSGNYWTWKVGLDWHLNDTIRVRGTRSRDIRAPSLYELFAPTGTVPVKPVDTLTGLSPSVLEYDQSNANLKAEIANTWTAGVIWTPSRHLSIALDYYDIDLNSAIVQITGSATYVQNACYASGGTSPFCALQSRPNGFGDTSAANAVTRWFSQYENIGSIKTHGADVEFNYSTTLFGRPASARLLGDYQPHVYYAQPGTPTTDQGGVAFGPLGLGAGAKLRATAFLRAQPVEHVTVDLMERWRDAMKLGGDPTQVWVYNHLAAFATTNLTVTTDFETRHVRGQFFVAITNLFDADPPVGAYSGNGTRAGLRDGFALGDDPTGRYFSVGVKLKL